MVSNLLMRNYGRMLIAAFFSPTFLVEMIKSRHFPSRCSSLLMCQKIQFQPTGGKVSATGDEGCFRPRTYANSTEKFPAVISALSSQPALVTRLSW